MNAAVDAKFRDATKWRKEANALRKILLDCGLGEELKWGKPCYTFDGKNVVLIQRQNDFLALLFFKGGLMKDPKGVLKKPGDNSRVGRRMHFTSVGEVHGHRPVLEAYVREAIELQNAGVKMDGPAKLDFADELRDAFDANPALEAAFHALTPGRQRHYNMHFSDAKQSKTRRARIDRHTPRILDCKGLRDP